MVDGPFTPVCLECGRHVMICLCSKRTDDVERAMKVAAELVAATERLNDALRRCELTAFEARVPAREARVVVHSGVRMNKPRDHILGWDGVRLTWDGAPLLSQSRLVRCLVVEHLHRVIRWTSDPVSSWKTGLP